MAEGLGADRARLVGAGLALAIFVTACVCLWPHGIDDAYISALYARNLAQGHGLVFQPGDVPVEGYSNFLFVLLTAAGARLGGEAIVAAKSIAVVSGVLCLLLLLRVAQLITPPHAYLAPLLWATSFPAAYWSVVGLETSLMALGVLAWLYGALQVARWPGWRGGYWWLGAATGLLPLIRPEGILFVAAYLVVLVWVAKREGRSLPMCGPTAVGLLLAAYVIWKVSYFGAVLPMPFYAKVEAGSLPQKLSGALYLHKGLWQYAGGGLGYLALLFGAWQGVRRANRDPAVALCFLAALPLLLFVVLAGADWMPQGRFLVPALAPLYLLLAALLTVASRSLSPGRLWLWGGVLAVLAGNAVGALSALRAGDEPSAWGERIRLHTAAVRSQEAQGRWLAAHGGPALTVAALDIGALAYYSGSRIIDLHGLTNPDVAGQDEASVARYVLERRPDYIQVYGHALNADPVFRRDYRPVPSVPWALHVRRDLASGQE